MPVRFTPPATLGPISRRSACLALPGLLLAACATPDKRQTVARVRSSNAVVPFSQSAVSDEIPAGWQPYIMRRDLPATRYRMAECDVRWALHASGTGVSAGLQCLVDANPVATPWLRWDWKVKDISPAISVADGDTDDSPARVVVAFEGDEARLSAKDRAFYDLVELFTGRRLPYATLMYLWDGQLPVGATRTYQRSGRIQYQVVESGPQRLGQWLRYERNVAQDFERIFGEPPPGNIVSIGVLTDSDDIPTEVHAWYGDIGLFDRKAG